MIQKRVLTFAVVTAALLAPLVAAADGVANLWPGTTADGPTPLMPGAPDILKNELAKFDDLDFRVYSTQQWQDVQLTHAQDIVVHLPDGTYTTGLDQHIQYMKWMFTFAPDTNIHEHPVRFGTNDAEWTSVTSWLTGTFTQPLVLQDGTVIQPTGLRFRVPMATIGHWNTDGLMTEEYLFWDNKALFDQLLPPKQ